MSKPKVYVTRRVPVDGLELLQRKCEVKIWDDDEVIPRKTLLENTKGINGIFCLITETIDAEFLDAAGPDLRVVATMSVGTDHIDLKECKKRGVFVSNTPDIASDSAADLTVALVLMTTRRLVEGVDAVRQGQWSQWKPMWLCGSNMMSKTIGILGFGRVGFGVARRLKPFGVKEIIYNDIRTQEFAKEIATFVPFDDLLEKSDIICICCAMTSLTKHLFNQNTFNKMKRKPVLINTSRGGIVQHDDLYIALTSSQISAAGLDVTEPEPLPSDHPLVSLPNCVILPHMGTSTKEARKSMSINTAKNILAVLDLTDSD